VDPEFALRETNAKFRRRFAAMEAATDVPLEGQGPEALERLWVEAKAQERSTK
jgi:nucleoside triphosphate diphosphatase